MALREAPPAAAAMWHPWPRARHPDLALGRRGRATLQPRVRPLGLRTRLRGCARGLRGRARGLRGHRYRPHRCRAAGGTKNFASITQHGRNLKPWPHIYLSYSL